MHLRKSLGDPLNVSESREDDRDLSVPLDVSESRDPREVSDPRDEEKDPREESDSLFFRKRLIRRACFTARRICDGMNAN